MEESRNTWPWVGKENTFRSVVQVEFTNPKGERCVTFARHPLASLYAEVTGRESLVVVFLREDRFTPEQAGTIATTVLEDLSGCAPAEAQLTNRGRRGDELT